MGTFGMQERHPAQSRSSKAHEGHTWAGAVRSAQTATAWPTPSGAGAQDLRRHFGETSPVSAPSRDWEWPSTSSWPIRRWSTGARHNDRVTRNVRARQPVSA